MDRYWIRIWRKTLDNDVFKHDPTAWRVFEYLLLVADRKTGMVDTGRFRIADALFMPSSTVYDALQRLKKRKMIVIDTNTTFSRVTIVKWKLYQQPDNTFGNNRPTTEQHSTIYKKEEYIAVEKDRLSNDQLEKGREILKEQKRRLAEKKSINQ